MAGSIEVQPTGRKVAAASASVVPPGVIPRGANFILGGLAGQVCLKFLAIHIMLHEHYFFYFLVTQGSYPLSGNVVLLYVLGWLVQWDFLFHPCVINCGNLLVLVCCLVSTVGNLITVNGMSLCAADEVNGFICQAANWQGSLKQLRRFAMLLSRCFAAMHVQAYALSCCTNVTQSQTLVIDFIYTCKLNGSKYTEMILQEGLCEESILYWYSRIIQQKFSVRLYKLSLASDSPYGCRMDTVVAAV